MFKKIFVGILLTILVAAAATGIYQYTQTASAQAVTTPSVAGTGDYGLGQGGGQAFRGGQANNPVDLTGQSDSPLQSHAQTQEQQLPAMSELSSAEAESLIYMLEEEKLARDVYTALYSTWGLPVFQNIASSEQEHMNAVKTLVERYGLEVPALDQAGTFTNLDLQKLYTDLVSRGSQSIAEAIKVGGAIEEIDILDLQRSLTETDNADIQQVFNNLLSGSENHLRAFSNTLLNQVGETYAPQYMNAEQYQSILASNAGSGYGAGGAGGYGQGGQYGKGGQQGGQRGGGGQGGQGAGGNRP